MSSSDNNQVRVTGDERRRPEIRSLARACIALARLRLEKEAQADHVANSQEAATDVPESTAGDVSGEVAHD